MNWIFLRGLVRESRHWAGFPERFEREVPGAKAHMIDLPGIGTEAHRLSPATMDGIVADLRSRWLTVAEKNPGDWSIFSISLGSMAAIRWSQLFPADFRRVVLINTSAADLSPPWKRLSAGRWPDIFGLARLKEKAEKERRVLDMTLNMRADKDELALAWAKFSLPDPRRAQLAARQLAAALTFLCPRRLYVPALVLRSLGDRLVDPDCSERVARRLDARLVTHGLAGHDLPLDDAEWTIEKVREWLEGA